MAPREKLLNILKFKLWILGMVLISANNSSAQLVCDLPMYQINDVDMVVFYSESKSLSGCTSIEFTMDYDSALDWTGPAPSNESASECGGCAGDISDPEGPGCANCWDFLFFEMLFDGSVELTELIGTTYLPVNETFTWVSDCLDPLQTYDIQLDIQGQNWQDQEIFTMDNIMIICHQALEDSDIDADPDFSLCEGEDLVLEIPSDFDDAEWFFMGVSIANGFNLTLVDPTSFNSGMYSVVTTDVNGCTSSEAFMVNVAPIPDSCPLNDPIESCTTGGTSEATIDLTVYDGEINCFTSDDVLWFESIGDIPDFPIDDPDDFQTTTTTLYGVVYNGTCYSDEQPVIVNVTAGLDPGILNTSPIICAGEDLEFDVLDAPSNADFAWDGPPGSGVSNDMTTDPEYVLPGATDNYSGTWTVTVTDDAGCTGTATTDISVTPGPTGTISGGGPLCPGYCTDITTDLMLDLMGGTQPYDATIEISVFIINQEITLPNFLPNGTVTLCVDPDGFLPGFSDFNGDGTDDIIVPNLALNFSVELLDIEDANGCQGVGSGVISYTIQPEPSASDPDMYELCESNPFDLTTFDDDINATLDVLWYEDVDLNNQILDPTAYVPTATPTTVYAVVDNGTCISQAVDLGLNYFLLPVLDPIANQEACEMYTLPPIDGTNLGTNPYYQDAAGVQYAAGDNITETGTISVFAGDITNCMATIDFDVTIIPLPNLLTPQDELTGCGSIELPTIVSTDLVGTGFEGYFTGPNQTGDSYTESDIINETDGITELYIYISNSANCFIEELIDLNFTSNIEYILPTYPATECGDFELLPVGGATAGLAYFTETMGGGDMYLPGEVLVAPGTYTLYVYDPTIDQSCVNNADESFTIELLSQPTIDPLDDVTVCSGDGYELPIIQGLLLTGDEVYSVEPDGSGDLYDVGDVITQTMTLYIINTGSCSAIEQVFMVTVIEQPVAGTDNTFETCLGATIDLNTLLSSDAGDGVFSLFGVNIEEDNELWDTSTATEDTPYEYLYIVEDTEGVCDPDSAFITINLTSDVSAGTPVNDPFVCGGFTYDLYEFLEGETTGGVFVDTSNPFDTLTDSEWFAVGNTTFEYIIMDDDCGEAQTTLELEVLNSLNIQSVMTDTIFCPGSCVELSYSSSGPLDLGVVILDDLGSIIFNLDIVVDDIEMYQVCMDGTGVGVSADTIYLGSDPNLYTLTYQSVNSATSSCPVDVAGLEIYNLNLGDGFELNVEGEVCNGLGFMYEGTTYFENDTITGQTVAGCDSVVYIQVTEFPLAEEMVTGTYCIGTPVPIGGVDYTEDTVTTVMLEGESVNGCDSIIMIDITFDNASYYVVDPTLCEDGFEEIMGTIYDIDNPTDEILLEDASVAGCDSIIQINLSFHTSEIGTREEIICQGDSIEIDGVQFFEGYESDLLLLDLLDMNGCDSMVQVDVTFFTSIVGEYSDTICPGDTTEVEGVSFFVGYESDLLTLDLQDENGCDSLLMVNIDFFPTTELNEEYEKCEGDTLTVNGYTITDDNLNGFYQLDDTVTDCATIVNYITTNFASAEFAMDSLVCQGQSIDFNGMTLNETNPFGQIVLEGMAANGCDSLVSMQLDFENADAQIVDELIGANEYQLNITGDYGTEVDWSSSSGELSCMQCDDPSISITEDTEVYVTSITESGCAVFDTINISFLPEEVFSGIYFPNVFTPDEASLNNQYRIFSSPGFMIEEFYVYDRWGNRLFVAENFSPEDESVFWDGTHQGDNLNPGVYVGLVRYLDPNGEQFTKAFDITLIR